MTAIAGVVGALEDSSHERLCRAAIAAQREYGLREPTFHVSRDAAFGISLYDLLPEDRFDRQPLWDERFQLVADIRLDNRTEVLNLLGKSDQAFTKQSDSDVLFLALRSLGEHCLDHLSGDFAFAFHDAVANRLILARDPMGHRPLCYAARGDSIAFASMPSGLMAGRNPRLDRSAFALRLLGLLLPTGRTYFENIASIRPGEVIVFEGNKATARTYWQPLRKTPSNAEGSQWTELFRGQLDAAVGRQLRTCSTVIASQLSSGYDSNAVTATAARLLAPPHRLLALTAAPVPGVEWLASKNRIADESPLASLTAAMHSIEHLVIRDPKPLLDPLFNSTGVNQEPLPHLLNFGWWTALLHAARSRGASSILSGNMGNFTISYGGVHTLPYMIRGGHWLTWWREARAAVSKNQNRWRGILMSSFEPWIPRAARNALYRSFVGTPAESRFCFVRSPLADEARQMASSGPALSGDLATDRLQWMRRGDRGIHSKAILALTKVELRDPTADRQLIEFCLSLPLEQLIHDGVYRPLARRALADRVPPAILNMPNRGYQGADWYARLRRADALAILEEVSASHTACELLDIPKIRLAIDEWPNPQRDSYETVFDFGRKLTDALASGKFIADVERNSSSA